MWVFQMLYLASRIRGTKQGWTLTWYYLFNPYLAKIFFLDLFLSYYLSTEDPSGKRRKREDPFDDISLTNKPEKELACKIRTRIQILILHFDKNILHINKNILHLLVNNIIAQSICICQKSRSYCRFSINGSNVLVYRRQCQSNRVFTIFCNCRRHKDRTR